MSSRDLLILANGQPNYGIHPQGIERINYLDYDLRTPMDSKCSRFSKKLKFNQFQFVSFISPDLIVGLAIVDLKLVSNAFIYLYEPKSGFFEEFSFLQPFSRHTHIAATPNAGESHFTKGNNHLSITASRTPGVRQVKVRIANKVSIDATIDESTRYQPLAVCTRAGYNGWVYTQKSTAQACEGTIKWQQQHYHLNQIGALAAVDWSGGFMRKHTFWNWGSLSHRLSDGRLLGFNLAAGVNETGFSENALWLDGRMYKVDMVDFQFDRYQHNTTWALRSADGIIDLHFTPAGNRHEKINALFIASNFRQFFGRFHGEIHLPTETIVLQDAWGLTEDHFAKW